MAWVWLKSEEPEVSKNQSASYDFNGSVKCDPDSGVRWEGRKSSEYYHSKSGAYQAIILFLNSFPQTKVLIKADERSMGQQKSLH